MRTGAGWKTPPGRLGMAIQDPVKRERKPAALFPSGGFKPLSVSIPGMSGLLNCAWSRLS